MDVGDVKAVETVMKMNDLMVDGKQLCDIIPNQSGVFFFGQIL